MPNMDNGIQQGCNILPFAKQGIDESKASHSTTMAVLLAVTVVHDEGVSADDRLIDIIEQSGEVEILDTEDALSGLGIRAEMPDDDPAELSIANDNAPAVVAT